ncbi:MAG TPA: response regulator, partial [Lacunisphaera sp.]|nr:response regulator [Lacunisphaera sp.]
THPDQGTTFQVLLPANPDQVDGSVGQAVANIPRGRGELILVVDDDASVREITCASLVAHGYRVLASQDGAEGLALFAPRHLDVRAIVSDIDMPELDGAALSTIARKLNPSVRVILVSGSAEIRDPRRQPPPDGAFLSKPFSADTLLATLHRLLNPAVPGELGNLERPATGVGMNSNQGVLR